MSASPISQTEPAARRLLSSRRTVDVERRRREVALTATWLRELRGMTGASGNITRGGRFTRDR